MRPIVSLATPALAALVMGAALAQPGPELAFEVASIRPVNSSSDGPANLGIRIDGAQYRANFALREYLSNAYRVKPYQVTGPDWLGADRFEIAATLPAGAKPDQIPDMLRTLLLERFQIKMHRDKKDFPVYVLEVAKGGLKMQESPATTETDAKPAVDVGVTASDQGVAVSLGGGASYSLSNNRLEGRKLSMASFASNLERYLDRPVVDTTNLKGRYDFALNLTDEDYRSMMIRAAVTSGVVLPPQALRALDNGQPVSLLRAVETLGLKLDARKAPLEVVVIDSARRTPTDN